MNFYLSLVLDCTSMDEVIVRVLVCVKSGRMAILHISFDI